MVIRAFWPLGRQSEYGETLVSTTIPLTDIRASSGAIPRAPHETPPHAHHLSTRPRTITQWKRPSAHRRSHRAAETLTLEELVERTNAALARLPDSRDAAPFNERTVRYYVSEGLLPCSGTRGPGARYPEGFIWRLLFVRRLQREARLALDDIRSAMEQVTEDTMQSVVQGRAPLDIRGHATAQEVRARQQSGEQMVPLAEVPLADYESPDNRSAVLSDRGPDAGDPSDYLNQVAGKFGQQPGKRPAPRRPTLQSHTVWRNERAMIRVRGRVTPAQKKQIEHLGALLANILEEDRS